MSILCVNVTRLTGAQIAGNALFLDVSVKVSQKEIDTDLCTLRMTNPRHHRCKEDKKQKKGKFALSSAFNGT